MNYTLHQLQVFLQVVKTQSVTKAARELNLTQPAVSIQLKKLQDQFDIPLSEVIGRKIYITDFGHEIALAAENILNQVHAINFKTMAYKGQLAGRLRISVVSTGKYVMPYFISDFMAQHPGINLQMDVTNKQRVTESLEHNEVDFSLVSILPKSMDVETLELLPNKLFLVGNSRQVPTTKRNVRTVFNQHPLIFREEGSGTRQTMEHFIRSNQISVVKKLELTSNEAVKQAVLAGLGFSIMPLIGIKNELRNNELQIIPIKGLPIQTMWTLIWPKSKNHAPVARAILDHIEKERSQLVNTYFHWYESY